MIVLILLIELMFAFFEGGLIWLLLTLGALFSFIATFKSNENSYKLVSEYLSKEGNFVSRIKKYFGIKRDSSTPITRQMKFQYFLHLHSVFIPPWFAPFLIDDYFLAGAYIVPFTSLVCFALSRMAIKN